MSETYIPAALFAAWFAGMLVGWLIVFLTDGDEGEPIAFLFVIAWPVVVAVALPVLAVMLPCYAAAWLARRLLRRKAPAHAD